MRERHVGVKDEAKIEAEELIDWDDTLLKDSWIRKFETLFCADKEKC